MNPRRILAVAGKERRVILRDRLFFVLAFIIPAFLMAIFNFGLTLDVESLPFAAIDYDGSPRSRELASRFVQSRFFDFKGFLTDEEAVPELLAENEVRAVLIIPEHFGKTLQGPDRASVQTLIDGQYPSRARTVRGYVRGIVGAFSLDRASERLARMRGLSRSEAREHLQPIGLEVRYLFNPSLESDWSLAPKFMMLILIIVPPLMTSIGVVREKETGSIDNVNASTVTRGEFMAGKLLPYVLIASVNILVLWGMASLGFGAPFRGSPLFFLGSSVLYVVCTSGIGLLISLLVRTQVAAVLVTFIATTLPTVLFSGIFIPVQSLDAGGRVMAHLLPAMYYTNIVTGSFLKGIGLDVLWLDGLVLGAYAAGLLGLSYCLFSKRPKA